MKYLADTDYVIDYLNGRSAAVEALTSVSAVLSISIITYGEVLEGILWSSQAADRAEAFESFLREPALLTVDRSVARTWAQLSCALREARTPLPDADLLIAATAITHNAILMTRNRKHFERIPGLTLYAA